MNVLYITHRVPYPPDKGDRIRNWHVLRQLARYARVNLAALADEPVPDSTLRKLNEICNEVTVVPVSKFLRTAGALKSALVGCSLSEGVFSNPVLKKQIEAWHLGSPFDAVVISASSLVAYARALRGVPVFVDVVDVDSQKWLDFAKVVPLLKRWLYRFEAGRIRRVERDLPGWAHTITLVSDAESRLFDAIAGKRCAITATNGVDLDFFSVSRGADSNVIAFTGAMDYLPNIDAVTWFANRVWPTLTRTIPGLRFRIIGRNPAPEVRKLASIGIEVTGSVADVRECLKDVAAVVVPMRLGRGLQNKVLEAMAMGKPVIASPVALEALKTVPGCDLLKAESELEWCEAVLQLVMHETCRRELGLNARQFVENHHDWATCLEPMMDRLRNVVQHSSVVKTSGMVLSEKPMEAVR